ncbi:uncharacterized protein FRV6_09681 [Fusarium oxysporum]|uniref:Uncharacterized protein n=1 Tax=Fusarium oxysporum TaxID=5507 RepID=A0A2H3TA05_FUSOX|nr:uncharacterized protein FRV6_09681 [Fusarium oxysporum]
MGIAEDETGLRTEEKRFKPRDIASNNPEEPVFEYRILEYISLEQTYLGSEKKTQGFNGKHPNYTNKKN